MLMRKPVRVISMQSSHLRRASLCLSAEVLIIADGTCADSEKHLALGEYSAELLSLVSRRDGQRSECREAAWLNEACWRRAGSRQQRRKRK